MSNLLMIFTRNPELGKVKTRLAKTIGDEAALEIYKFLLEHTVKVTKDLKADKATYYSVSNINNDIWDPALYQKKEQKGDDLGERMHNAFSEAFQNGYEKVIIIGSDMYDITSEHIEEAFTQLDNNEIVVGPAEDGGYYLLGLKKPIRAIFENKAWGTDTVFQDTMKDLTNNQVHLLETLNDIDVYEDIAGKEVFQPFLKKINI